MQLPGSELFLEGLIDALLPLDATHPGKFRTNDESLEMLAVAIQGEMLTGHAGENEFFDLIGVHMVRP